MLHPHRRPLIVGAMVKARHPVKVVAVALLATLAAGCNSLFGIEEGKRRPICAETDPLEPLIDDMEDRDGSICPLGGRNGFWYAVGDKTSADPTPGLPFKQTKIPDGERGTSQYAARFTGAGFTAWGATMGFDLNRSDQSLGSQPYNASKVNGIKFWMKSDVPVQVAFRTQETVILDHGGECIGTQTNNDCDDDYSFQIGAPGPGWREYEVPFAALDQRAGYATWNPQHLLAIQFNVPPGSPFDVWVDDVRFYVRCSSAGCLPTCSDPAFPVACPLRGRPGAGCLPPGTDCAAAAAGCDDPVVIDDMEDGNSALCDTGGRRGRWIVHGDRSSPDLMPRDLTFAATPIPGSRGTSHFAARLQGSGFLDWGANMGFDLTEIAAGEPRPYDASQFGGIRFWMKNDVPVSVGFSVPATVPKDSPFGTCNDGGFRNCYNDFVFDAPPSGNEWVEHAIPFAALEQRPLRNGSGNLVGGSAKSDPAHLLGIVFSAHYSAFDFWIDDLRFDPCLADCFPTCSAEEPVACPASGALPAGCWPEGTDCSKPRERVRNTAVWGSGPDDVWVVGYSRTTLQGSLRHWKGSGWTPATSGTSPPIWGVWGSSADSVWAVGDRGTVLSWNGSAWSSAAAAPATATFNGVGGGGANDVWAIESPGTMLHRTDSAWVPTATGTAERIEGVWGLAPGDVWAVGDHGTLLHWNGALWSASTSGVLPFTAVWGSGSDDVWAVGRAGAVAHLTGSVWSAVPSTTVQNLRGVWGSGPDDVWAVGEVGTIVHWDGAAWSAVPSGTTQRLLGVWGSGPRDVWVVGLEIILRWNGQAWSIQR